MKNFFLTCMLFMCSLLGAKGESTSQRYVYLCFGQSNMEGNATPESVDYQNIDARFKMLASCNFQSPARTLGNWYEPTPPIVNPNGGLGLCDYFGRTMVANLPDNISVGVIAVAMGGSPIEMFDKDKYAETIQRKEKDGSTPWWATLATMHYGGNPYGRLIEMGKKAQNEGAVIKGILLHQGCSNCGDPEWPNMVKKIYEDMLTDLGLQAADVPLLVGETERQEMGGGCYYHNTVVAKIPEVVPTSHVISSEAIPGNGKDAWHFSAAGYRTFGKRYAKKALELLGIEAEIGDDDVPEPVILEGDLTIDKRFTSLAEIGTTPFAIVNEQEGKAFYGINDQHLGYADNPTAFVPTVSGYLFKLEKCNDVTNGYFLRLITPDGLPYNVWGGYAPGYLNSQLETGNCCFILGNSESNPNSKHNGQDMENGAVWEMECVADKGFSLKNIGTGKYLKTADAAKYTTPTYFTLCTLKSATSGVTPIRTVKPQDDAIYTLDGRRVNAANLRPGIYIVNGKKMIR